jgi:chromosome segregation ATPase
MTLTQEDIDFIKTNMADWLVEQSLGKPPAVYEIELRERMVRVEEELKHQRELMRQGFAQVEKRFEQVDKRFEQVDKRFEQVDKRFESVQQDIRELQRRMDRFMVWSFGTTVAVGGMVVTLVKFWNP